MSRRNQSRRRRSYGRRQHELRQRRPGEATDMRWDEPAALDQHAPPQLRWPGHDAEELRA